MKSVKVVFNACYGGFSISRKAAMRLFEMGVTELEEQLKDQDKQESRFSNDSFFLDMDRHDPRLVQVVEELGVDACGPFASLRVAELVGNRYRVDEYDGFESVQEPDDIDWIIVE
jgi:hypothetical protein